MKSKNLFLALTLSLLMTACSNSNVQEDNVDKLDIIETSEESITYDSEETTESNTPSVGKSDTTQEITSLNESDISNLNDLNLLSSVESSTVSIKLLSSVELDENGFAMFDDSNEFAVVASVGDKDFVLMDKQIIQLGVPKVSLYENVEGKTVIILSDIRSAKYDIYEYTYDESLGGFSVIYLTRNEGINFIGETLVK